MFGTKKKLMAAVVMLVISAIMMTSASYAWFTISTNPEIKAMETQVVVNENLEIALLTGSTKPTQLPGTDINQTGNYYSWGNLVDLTSNATYTDTLFVKSLRPARLYSSTPNVFQCPVYGADGRISHFDKLNETSYGFGNLTYTSSVDTEIYAYYVDFWVRSNVGGNLTLSADEKRSSSGEQGLGSYFQSNKNTPADKVLASNIYVAFKDVTPTEILGAEPASTSPATYPVAIDHTTAEAVPVDTTAYKVEFNTDQVIVKLNPNSAKLIRMYVYLEGENVTNASASLDGTDNTIGGKLNIQFGIAEVDHSMDGQP